MKNRHFMGVLALSGAAYLIWNRGKNAGEENVNQWSAPSMSRDSLHKEPPAGLMGAAVAGAFGFFLWYETKRPLRRQTESKSRRDVRNTAVAVVAALTLLFAEKPVTKALTHQVHCRHWGLLKLIALPAWLEVPVAVVLMDYSMYLWHVLTHKVPLLWRFHRVHHADLDLDMSTALRFHFGEMLLSVPWRMMQIVSIGVSRLPLSIWQTMTMVAILFHHSNSRLPIRLERPLSRLLMTPRMHGIHHSVVNDERNSNWATIFSFPDYVHCTHRFDIAQEDITIGIPEPRNRDQLTLGRLLAMPFKPQRPVLRHSVSSAGERL